MRQKLFIWEASGAIFIIVLGILMHFAFEWSNKWTPLAAITAANESVWEHLKLTFFPTLIWAIIELRPLKKYRSNFLMAKTLQLYLMPIITVFLFYTYSGIIGDNFMAVDVIIFIITVIIGQYVSYRILSSNNVPVIYKNFSIILFIIIILAFSLFTFYPPHLPLFKDQSSGKYGIFK